MKLKIMGARGGLLTTVDVYSFAEASSVVAGFQKQLDDWDGKSEVSDIVRNFDGSEPQVRDYFGFTWFLEDDEWYKNINFNEGDRVVLPKDVPVVGLPEERGVVEGVDGRSVIVRLDEKYSKDEFDDCLRETGSSSVALESEFDAK
jgi:hypothetical protein